MAEPHRMTSDHPVLVELLRRFPHGLPATLSVEEAAPLMRISPGLAWKGIRADEWPSPVWRLGRKILIPTAPFLEALGLRLDGEAGQESSGGSLRLAGQEGARE